MKIVIAWRLLFIALLGLLFHIHKRFKEEAVLSQIKSKYEGDMQKRIESEAYFIKNFGEMENKSFLYKLDRMILTSGLKARFKWMSGEIYLLIIIGFSLVGLVVGLACFQNIFAAAFLSAVMVFICYAFVQVLASKVYNELEDATAVFVSLLCNHAKGSSDIVTIMSRTYPSTTGTLRKLVYQFLEDAKTYGNVDIALDYMKEAVDNKQLRCVITNIKNTGHFMSNYEETLAQMANQISATLSAREDRKNILFSMKITLFGISVASLVIVAFIGAGLDIDVISILKSNVIGKTIMFCTGVMYLFVTAKLFKTDR